MAERRSKKRVEKTGKRYAQKDRRVPRKKEYGTRARTATQTSKGKGKFTWGDEMDDYYQYIDYEQQLLEDELAQQYVPCTHWLMFCTQNLRMWLLPLCLNIVPLRAGNTGRFVASNVMLIGNHSLAGYPR